MKFLRTLPLGTWLQEAPVPPAKSDILGLRTWGFAPLETQRGVAAGSTQRTSLQHQPQNAGAQCLKPHQQWFTLLDLQHQMSGFFA